MAVISEDNINRWIVPHLSVRKRGLKLQVKASEIVSVILYKLKTGCQWRGLPTKECFGGRRISWQGVYYHFSKWANDGSLRKAWTALMKSQRRLLNLSCVQLDGSHIICKNGERILATRPGKRPKAATAYFSRTAPADLQPTCVRGPSRPV